MLRHMSPESPRSGGSRQGRDGAPKPRGGSDHRGAPRPRSEGRAGPARPTPAQAGTRASSRSNAGSARFTGAGGAKGRGSSRGPSDGAKTGVFPSRSREARPARGAGQDRTGRGAPRGAGAYPSRSREGRPARGSSPEPTERGAPREARHDRFGGDRAGSQRAFRSGPARRPASQPDDRPPRRGAQPARGSRQDDGFRRQDDGFRRQDEGFRRQDHGFGPQGPEPGPHWGRPRGPVSSGAVEPGRRATPSAEAHERGPSRYRSRAQSRDDQPYSKRSPDRRAGGRTDGTSFPSSRRRDQPGEYGRGSSAGGYGRGPSTGGYGRGPDGTRGAEPRPRDFNSDRGRGYGRSAGGSYERGGRKDVAPRPLPRARDRELPANWGSVTRRGARALSYEGPSASEIWSAARESARPQPQRNPTRALAAGAAQLAREDVKRQAAPLESEDWELVETVPASGRRNSAKPSNRRAPAAGGRDAPRAQRLGPRSVASPSPAGHDKTFQKATAKLEDAARAYSADRYQDALRILRKLVAQSPDSAPVRELLGLTLYRMGRWPLAVNELHAHHDLSGSYDQFPVIADCYRAMRRYVEADETWEQLRQASPSAEVVAEGRLVAAGSLADQGDLRGAVKLLEASLRRSRPRAQHLRQWYALADLYERAGELPRARELFSQIASVDPDAYDVRQRLVALG
jgi:tetratricopeptide (TPR) repeat protein